MTIFSRSTLEHAFPNNPRARAEFEKLDALLSSVDAGGATLADRIAELQTLLGSDGGVQSFSSLLQGIADSSDTDLGVFEKTGPGEVIVHEVDSADDSCLVPRYKLMSYVGKGATTARPALSNQRRAVYFDTTLAAAGKPVFWTGVAWVDATGAAV